MSVKKLIEVALPLDKINTESAREKSIRHGHPSTLHLWWARRPLAAARAVIWSSLVDDPSSHPELFPTEEAQNEERKRLFKILEDLVVWENSNNEDVLKAARIEILRSTNGTPPALLDPFAGGGAIPLEAQRLGLETHAHDLNPVAVMINKAMIEIPPKFDSFPPVNPDDNVSVVNSTWRGAQGIAADVKYYGNWVKKEASKRIGHMYPKIKIPKEQGGGDANVIAWIWARTIKCPNPACGCDMPLASSFVLSNKKNHEAWAEPTYSNNILRFSVHQGKCPKGRESNKSGHSGTFICPNCGETTSPDYTKSTAQQIGLRKTLMAIVAEGKRGRIYCSPDLEHVLADNVERPSNAPTVPMSNDRRAITPPDYGMPNFEDLYSNRQLFAITTFCNLVNEVQEKIEEDALDRGLSNDHLKLSNGGNGAKAYSEAIGVYLAFAVDKMSDRSSSLCRWDSSRDGIGNTFGRQALPMVWTFAESNPIGDSSGSFSSALNFIYDFLNSLVLSNLGTGMAHQQDAQSDCGLREVMVSTDPPYYDNIG